MTCCADVEARRRFVFLFVALAAVGCLSQKIIPLPSEIARFAVAAVLAAFTLAWAVRTRLSAHLAVGVALAVVGIAGVVTSPWPALRLAALSIWIGGIGFGWMGDEERQSLTGPMCAALALVILDLVPTLQLLAVEASAGLSRILLSPFGGGSLSGASGGVVALLALLISLAGTRRRAARPWQKLGALLALVVLFVGQLVVERHISTVAVRIACSSGAFLFGALVAAGYAARRPTYSSATAPRRVGDALLAGLATLCILLPVFLAVADGLRDAAQPPKRVLLFDVAMLADYRTPADKPLGQAFTGASFGSLPLYLMAYGHDCSIVATIDVGVALQADVVVVINPGRPFTPEEREILSEFVRGGGGLLALADHTDIGGLMTSFNDLLAATGLKLNFDSAVSARHSWRGSLVVPYPESVVFRGADVPVSIGASVSGGPWWSGSRPLLLGTDAFSDPGNRANEQALLGNLAFDPGEDYGDVLLAVERRFGRGRIALFGDTSMFQNLSLASSCGYVDRMMRHLGGGAGVSPALPLIAAIVGIALLLVCARRVHGKALLLSVALVVAAGLAAADLVLARACAVRLPERSPFGVIDVAHANLVDRQALTATGIDALTAAVARTGVLPVVWDRPRAPGPLGEGDLWISIAATRPYSTSEVEGLRTAAEQGATLIVGTRWPYSASVTRLVGSLGLEVTNVPLGAVRPSVEGLADAPGFGSAWVVDADEAWTILARATVGDSSFPVVGERNLGRGRIAVVADTEVFTNEALEGRGYAFVENVRFLERLFRGEVKP